MESERFDSWTKTLARSRSRRGVLAVAAAAAVSLATRRLASAQMPTPGGFCGGIAGIPCPDGFTCMDDPRDDCDPMAGGADCGGVCVPIAMPMPTDPCAAMLCIEGTTCCPLCGGMCLSPETPCSEDLCPGDPGAPDDSGEPCNQTVCGPGEYCCNESCSICAPLGGGCIEQFCEPEEPVGIPCGPTVCAPDQVCCNESCGICTPPDGACIALYCG